MHSIGKIDRQIYRVVAEDIASEEVVITDRQLAHMQERHPDDYERYAAHISRILKEPDYILRANKPDTAVVLKAIVENGERLQLVLRLKTSHDPVDYHNSVITLFRIREREWNRLLCNKEVLYRGE